MLANQTFLIALIISCASSLFALQNNVFHVRLVQLSVLICGQKKQQQQQQEDHSHHITSPCLDSFLPPYYPLFCLLYRPVENIFCVPVRCSFYILQMFHSPPLISVLLRRRHRHHLTCPSFSIFIASTVNNSLAADVDLSRTPINSDERGFSLEILRVKNCPELRPCLMYPSMFIRGKEY